MNKLIGLLLIILIMPLYAAAETQLEYRQAAFFHANKRFRHIYGNVGTSYEVEATYRGCSCLAVWLNTDIFNKHGRVHDCGSSKINTVNFSGGVKYFYPLFECSEIYVGLGPNLARTRIRNKLCCSSNRNYKVSVGLVVKSGINVYLSECIFVDLFCDYVYLPTHYHHKTVDLGGLKLGAGIGTRF